MGDHRFDGTPEQWHGLPGIPYSIKQMEQFIIDGNVYTEDRGGYAGLKVIVGKKTTPPNGPVTYHFIVKSEKWSEEYLKKLQGGGWTLEETKDDKGNVMFAFGPADDPPIVDKSVVDADIEKFLFDKIPAITDSTLQRQTRNAVYNKLRP